MNTRSPISPTTVSDPIDDLSTARDDSLHALARRQEAYARYYGRNRARHAAAHHAWAEQHKRHRAQRSQAYRAFTQRTEQRHRAQAAWKQRRRPNETIQLRQKTIRKLHADKRSIHALPSQIDTFYTWVYRRGLDRLQERAARHVLLQEKRSTDDA